jgi:hypothetical protein
MMVNTVDKDTEVLIVFGFGCGYILDYLNNSFSKVDTVIFIEPTTQILKEVISREIVLSRLQNQNDLRIHFILNRSGKDLINDLMTMIIPIIKRKIGFIYQLTYRSVFSDIYEMVNEELRISIYRQKLMFGTSLANIYANLINNISSLRYKTLNLEDVLSKFEGLPFILVSAGPSLNKNMQLLKQMKNKAVIIAAGSAITILNNNGIEPHFRIAISPRDNEMNLFRGIDNTKIPLIFSGTVFHEVLKDYSAKKIRVIGNSSNVIRYIYTKIENNYSVVDGGYTVANVTLGLMCKAKASNIIIMGQDLSYSEGQFYAKGSWSNEIHNTEGEKFIKTKDIYGNNVVTEQLYLFTKEDFERQIRNFPNIKFYNATEGGLNIENAENVKLEDLISSFEDRKEIKEIVEYIHNDEAEKISDQRHESKIIVVKQIRDEVNEMLELNEERIEKLKHIQGLFDRKVSNNRISNEIDYIIKFGNRFDEFEYYKNVVKVEIKEVIDIISLSIQYFGDDILKKLEANQKYHLAVAYEVEKYLEYSRSLYDDVLKYQEQGEKDV